MHNADDSQPPAKPDWIRTRLGASCNANRLRAQLRSAGLHTVCEEALCPNLGRCWEHGHVTLMILGGRCTRSCRFCNVDRRPPLPVDAGEPLRVAQTVRAMRLHEVVITSVTRDDLDDGGAAVWADTIRTLRKAVPDVLLEVLVPDFSGSPGNLQTVMDARPGILGHNLEMVRERYADLRPEADYDRSLELLRRAHAYGLITKTALMLGLGETRQQVLQALRDARDTGCNIVCLGQYLQPSARHVPVREYVSPAQFDAWQTEALEMGFEVVVSAPLARSSYPDAAQSAYVRRRLKADRELPENNRT